MGNQLYNGEHSITIGGKHTWRDWHLMPDPRPVIEPPEPKFNYISVPGADGSLDASDAISKRVLFNNREGYFTFHIANGYEPWDAIYHKMQRDIQGKNVKAILDDDPLWYYEGRFWFSEPKQDQYWMKVFLNYNVKPYKKKIYSSTDEIGWDDLHLDDTVQMYAFADISVTGETILEFPASIIGRQANVPTFNVTSLESDDLTATFTNPELGITYDFSLSAGSFSTPRVIFSGEHNDNVCRLKTIGNGTFSIIFTSGEL